jgi:protein gp37
MAEKSAISWCRSTFNPWIGCTKVGPGCDHCYAAVSTPARTFGIKWGPGEPRKRTSIHNWNQPLKWNRLAPDSEFAGRKGFWPVFCASLADVFDNEVPDEWRRDLFALIDATPNLEWLLVTKRIGNVLKMIPAGWVCDVPKNVRLIITVVNQEEADRDIPKLLALNCKNGISYEPALGPVYFGNWLYLGRWDSTGKELPKGGIDWIIVGGESDQGGESARPFDVAWARDTIKQCKVADVPVFVKQLGSWPRSNQAEPDTDGFYAVALGPRESRFDLIYQDRAGADPTEWPAELRVQEFPL